MKTLRIFSLLILVMVTCSCAAQKTFTEISKMKGVTTIYIGKPMLRLAGASAGGNVVENVTTQIDISKIIGSLNSVEIVTCDTKAHSKAEAAVRKILESYPFEVITEVTEPDEKIEISAVMEGDDTILMLLISVSESDEYTCILMRGSIPMSVLEKALSDGNLNL